MEERIDLKDLPSPDEIPSHFWPRTAMGWVFTIFNIICFLLVYPPIVIAFNKPVAVLGLPLLYVWVTGVGLVWIAGIVILGFKFEGFIK